MTTFKPVEPFKCRDGVEAHLICASITKVHGTQYLICDRPIYNYAQAIALRDWLNAALGEDGYVLVPREPTEAMLDKGEFVNSEWLNDNAPLGQRMYREPAKAVYRAMLAAAIDQARKEGT